MHSLTHTALMHTRKEGKSTYRSQQLVKDVVSGDDDDNLVEVMTFALVLLLAIEQRKEEVVAEAQVVVCVGVNSDFL